MKTYTYQTTPASVWDWLAFILLAIVCSPILIWLYFKMKREEKADE